MKQTYRTLLNAAAGQLAAAGVENARYDARALLMEVFETDAAHLLLQEETALAQLMEAESLQKRLARYEALVTARAARVPLQQLLGKAYFCGLAFQVNSHVLTPRQDTETLVELVLADYREPDISLLDMCTGSGCIALSLAVLGAYKAVYAADISPEALSVARANAARLLPEALEQAEGAAGQSGKTQMFCLIESDLFSAFDGQRFDVITSNPPYIRTAVIETLEPEVRLHEPMLALDGTADGLAFYRRLAAEAPQHLKPGGRLYLEIGYDQAAEVSALLQAQGFRELTVVQDLAGNDRVIRAVTPAC